MESCAVGHFGAMDYYRILEVDYEAMDEEIRSNFIRVAMVCEFSATVATSVDNVGVAEVSSFGGRTLYATRYRIKVSNPISSNILTLRCAVELALRFSTLDDALEVGGRMKESITLINALLYTQLKSIVNVLRDAAEAMEVDEPATAPTISSERSVRRRSTMNCLGVRDLQPTTNNLAESSSAHAENTHCIRDEVPQCQVCDPEVLSEVPYSDSYPNDMINQDVQEMQYSEQTHIDDFQDNEIHSDSNTIPYSQYLQESQDAVQDTNSFAPNDLLVLSLVEHKTDHVAHLDKENQINKMVYKSLTTKLKRYKERVAIFKQRLNGNLNKREKLIDSQMDDLIWDRNAKLAAFQQEIDTLKQTLSNNAK
ncbi:hypothetical protein Tco_0790553 [Tanacetum coccineum]